MPEKETQTENGERSEGWRCDPKGKGTKGPQRRFLTVGDAAITPISCDSMTDPKVRRSLDGGACPESLAGEAAGRNGTV